jgi:cysteine-S-conjugate beta-lyase
MDFLTPTPILEALRGALNHGILGYELASRSLLELIAGRLERLYGWVVAPEAIVPIPNVNVGLRVAAWVVCSKGNGVLIQPPVFYPFIKIPVAYGWTRQEAPLRRVAHDQRISYELDRAISERAIHFRLCVRGHPIINGPRSFFC